MIRLISILFLLLAFVYASVAQSSSNPPNRFQKTCASGTPTKSLIEAESDGDLSLRACNTKRIRFFDPAFTGSFDTALYSFGTSTLYTVPTANTFTASELSFPLSISGTSKNYVGSRHNLAFQGSTTSPTILGQWNTISTQTLGLTGGGTLYGNFTSVDIAAPFTNVYGAYFAANAGGSGASGMGTITGILAATNPAHNGNTTNGFALDAWVTTSASDPSTITLSAGVRSRARFNPGVNHVTHRGIQITDWLSQGGTVENSVGLFIDNSIDVGTTSKYAILSTSTSAIKHAGDVYVTDTTKGIILKSPDGTCYRFTVANGGALSAGASVTCP